MVMSGGAAGGMGGSMGHGAAISGGSSKKVIDLFNVKHGRGPDKKPRKRKSSVANVMMSRPSGKTTQGRDVS